MKTSKTLFSLLAVAAWVMPLPEICAADPVSQAAQTSTPAKPSRTEFELPILTVSSEDEGNFERIWFEFQRRPVNRPLVVAIGDVESGGSGDEIRASVWSAATVAALMRGDLMNGTRISVEFPARVDGPSAGGVMCLAILSALDGREFPSDFAMTGTILPDGTIGLVGGVRQKIEAAAKAGIKRVCIPALGRVGESERGVVDLVDVAEQNGVELILVDTVEDAYAAAHRLPSPERKFFSEREVLSESREVEEKWYDSYFDNCNRSLSILRRHLSEDHLDDPFFRRYHDYLLYSRRLFKAGYFQRATEVAFDALLFMRAWDASQAEKDEFWRTYPDGVKIWNELVKNPEVPATDADKALLKAYREHIWSRLANSPRIPPREKDDKDLPQKPGGIGYYRDAPWITEITAQLEPHLEEADTAGWMRSLESYVVKELGDLKTKDDILHQIRVESQQEVLHRVGLERDNEPLRFLDFVAGTAQIRSNANLEDAVTFYHSACAAVRKSLESSLQSTEERGSLENNRHLQRFFFGCSESDERFFDIKRGKKLADPAYNALARVITDCRLLALGAALQIQYGPDAGWDWHVNRWWNYYENTFFLDALARSARAQALNSIRACREANLPCPAALSAFSEAEASRGNPERDQLFDVLANYWTAANIAQALTLCFDSQPSTEESAKNGNADALFRLGIRARQQRDLERAGSLFKQAAELGDARAQEALANLLLDEKKPKEALPWLEKAVAQQDRSASVKLAFLYWDGIEGVLKQDKKKAFSLFKKAAYLGSVEAQERLAWCYINEGEVVPENIALGVAWQDLAAERDNREAQFRMAWDYNRSAKDNKSNYYPAFRWFGRAAEQGHARAAADLGDCYYLGRGTEKDLKLAVKWFKESAELGDDYGQYNYGYCLVEGQGVDRDMVEGVKWLRKAAENGNEMAKKKLKQLEERGGESDSTNTESASLSGNSDGDSETELSVALADGVKMDMVLIPAGTFTMGSPSSEQNHEPDENQVRVTLSAFSLGKTEVTQAQWKAVMGNNPSGFKGDNLPVENVSWDEAMRFCEKLTSRERSAGRLSANMKFTLPTEAQWEYACRAGTTTRFSFGNADSSLAQYGNFYDKSGDSKYDAAFRERNGWTWGPNTEYDDGAVETARVASYRPNAWGLYDMHGNVWEWCLDYYNPSLSGGKDPVRTMPGSGQYGSRRVSRGGSWINPAQFCRSAFRDCFSPGYRNDGLGFRVALVQSSD